MPAESGPDDHVTKQVFIYVAELRKGGIIQVVEWCPMFWNSCLTDACTKSTT